MKQPLDRPPDLLILDLSRCALDSDEVISRLRAWPEWRLLEVLLRSPGRLLSRQQLLAQVWGPCPVRRRHASGLAAPAGACGMRGDA
jgi:CheY-like chemotaxis protein